MFEWATGFPAGSMYAPWPCRGASTSRPLRSTAECSCTSWCTSISGSGSGSWGSWLGTSGGRSGGATRSTRSRSKLEQRQRGWKDAMESTGSTVLAHAGGPTWCASRLGLAERPGAGGPDYGDFHVRDRWSARIGPAWRPQRGDRASPGAPGRRIIARLLGDLRGSPKGVPQPGGDAVTLSKAARSATHHLTRMVGRQPERGQ